jgi:hypothetical protein
MIHQQFITCAIFVILGILLPEDNLAIAQQTAIQSEMGNVLYVGVDNPVKIVMVEKPCAKVVAKATYGTLNREDKSCNYIYRNDSCATTREIIIVGYKSGSDTIWADTMVFRVLRPLSPVPFVSGKIYGPIRPEQLLKIPSIGIFLKDLHIEGVRFTVASYSVDIRRGDSILFKQFDNQGNRFSEELIAMIQQAEAGDIYRFYDITCVNCICWSIPPPIELRIRREY